MGMFLPDGQATPTGVSEFSPRSPQTTQEDVALMQRVFQAAAANPLMLPGDFMAYLVDYVQTSRLIIPIGQVFGFSQYNANVATQITTTESTSVNTYGDLATIGPILEGLADAVYLLFYSSVMRVSVGVNPGYMSVKLNSVEATDADGILSSSTSNIPGMGFTVATLKTGGNNTITARYKAGAGETATFLNRRLSAIKISNA